LVISIEALTAVEVIPQRLPGETEECLEQPP